MDLELMRIFILLRTVKNLEKSKISTNYERLKNIYFGVVHTLGPSKNEVTRRDEGVLKNLF